MTNPKVLLTGGNTNPKSAVVWVGRNTLTLFTRKQGVPIANSACEQSLKTPIAVRKMAYFFKTVDGAAVACIIFSLIQTGSYFNESVFDYFTAIQRNAKDARDNPSEWFPWNFRNRLKSFELQARATT